MACYTKRVYVRLSMHAKILVTLFYFRKEVQIHIIYLHNLMACYSKTVYVFIYVYYVFLLLCFKLVGLNIAYGDTKDMFSNCSDQVPRFCWGKILHNCIASALEWLWKICDELFLDCCGVGRFDGWRDWAWSAFHPPDIAEALTSTTATTARQAENVPSNSVQQQHMTGCCPRNFRQLNLGRVQPVSADIAGGQIAFLPHTMVRQQLRQGSNIMYGQPAHISQVPSSFAVQQTQIGGINTSKVVTNTMLMPPSHQFETSQVLTFVYVMMRVLLSWPKPWVCFLFINVILACRL